MAFKQFTADDLSPESLRARKAMVDANTPKPAPPAVSADGTKKSPFDLISVSKSPGMESLLSDTVKGGLEAKAAGVEGLPTGASSFATLKSFADRDALAGQGFLADYERRGDRDYSTARSALEKADRDAIDQVSRFLETHGLGRSALAGSNLGVSTELARVAGQASATARNPALLAMANLDADRTNRLNAARMGTLGRDYAIQSNLAGFGRDARLDPARALAADLSNVGAANAIERSLRFENVGGMFDVPGANTPRFGSSAYVPPIQRYNNPAVGRIVGGGGGGATSVTSAADHAYYQRYGVYPAYDDSWAADPERQAFFRRKGGRVGYTPPDRAERARLGNDSAHRLSVINAEREARDAARLFEEGNLTRGGDPTYQPLFPPNDFSNNFNRDVGNALSQDWNDSRFDTNGRANLTVPNFTGENFQLGENNDGNIFPVNY